MCIISRINIKTQSTMDFPLANTYGERGELFLQTPDDFHRQRLRVNKRLNTLRRKLNIITKDTKNYSRKNKAAVLTIEDYDSNPMFGDVLLFQAERDLLYAQETKLLLDVHFSRSKEQFIKSKYRRALKTLKHLISIMANEKDQLKVLEVLTYSALVRGLIDITMKKYSKVFASFATAKACLQFLYSHQNLPSRYTKEFYVDIIDLVIEPAVKVAESQDGTNKHINLTKLAADPAAFPYVDSLLLSNAIKIIQKTDPHFITRNDPQQSSTQQISWSTYTVDVERAEVAAAISKIIEESKQIKDGDSNSYDASLILYQDAISLQNAEIERNGKDIYDSENQEQYIVLTYLKYNALLLRIRRDIAMMNQLNNDFESNEKVSKQKTLESWREVLKVNDSVIESLKELKELPGVANDDNLVDFIQTLESFFVVKKQMKLAQAYLISNQYLNSLALIFNCSEIIDACKSFAGSSEGNLPTNNDIVVLKSEVEELKSKLYMLASYFSDTEKNRSVGSKYIVDNLEKVPKYSPAELIKNIAPSKVDFQPVNVKPVLFDIAFNYIGYDDAEEMEDDSVEEKSEVGQQEEEKKKGFFGLFGR